MKILLASRNVHKLRELRGLFRTLAGPDIEILSPDSVGLPPSPDEEGIEVHDTFEANALAKARWFARLVDLPVLADDSGLEVDLLDGAPGVRSRRFAPIPAGEPEPDDEDQRNIVHLLEKLGDAPLARRTARFVCVAAHVPRSDAGGQEHTIRGEAEGLILGRPRGWEGFGYDPVFLDPSSGRTFAELTSREKLERGHRGKAFRPMARWLATQDSS